MNTFGSVLKQAIQDRKFTLNAAAKAVGTYKGYISGIINRKIPPPSPKMIRKICKIFELDVNEMLARASFEKLPEGVAYVYLQDLISEVLGTGKTRAPGSIPGWKS